MKKYVVSIILIVLTFLLGMSNVNAASENLELVDVQVQSKNATIGVEDVTLSGNTVTSNITFNKVNDFVAFELTIKNNDDEEYKVVSAEDNNTNSNIAISYIYPNNYIKKGETTKVTVKLKYVNDLTEQDRLALKNLNVKINFAKPDGTTSQLSINPTTGISIFRYIFLAIISLIGIVLIIVKNKKKMGITLLILSLIAAPFSAIANEKFAISLKFNNIKVISEVNANNYAKLIDGSSFNEKLIYSNEKFRKATLEEYNQVKDELTEYNIISTEDSPKIAYMWDENNDIVYYSDAKTIYMNEDSSRMFANSNYSSIDLSGMNTSEVTTMQSMFMESGNLNELNLSSFDTSNVTDMSNMFENCYNLSELDLSTFDTSNVTDMSNMFYDLYNINTIYVFDEWNTSKVESANEMFYQTYTLTGEQGTSQAEYPYYVDYENYNDLNYAHVDEGVSNPGYLTLKGHTKDFSILLPGGEYGLAESLYYITPSAKYFRKATSEEYNSAKNSLTENNIVSVKWEDGDYALYYSDASTIYINAYADSMLSGAPYVTMDLSGLNSSRTTSMSGLFTYMHNLEEIIFGDFDTSNVKDMSSMFADTNFKTLDLSALDTSNVTSMSYMFGNCDNLEELDLSTLDISKVTSMYEMFNDSENLKTIYVSDAWDISNVENTSSMFYNAYSIMGEQGTEYDSAHDDGTYAHIDEGPSNPGYLTLKGHTKNFAILMGQNEYENKFNERLRSMTTENKDFRKATSEEYNSVKNELTEDNVVSAHNSPIKVYMWETDDSVLYYSSSPVIYMNKNSGGMFYETGFKSIDLSGFDTSIVTDMHYMFEYCENLEEIDLSMFDTSHISDMGSLFYDCENLKTIYVSNTWDISNVDNTSEMFLNTYDLVGEQATIFDSAHDDGTYAHIDEGPSNPGYLTLKGHTKNFAILMGYNDNGGNSTFNDKISSMTTENKEFRKATSTEYNSIKNELTEDNIVSISGSPIKVYMWETDDSVLYYSSSPIIYMNRDSRMMFNGTGFKSIDISDFDSALLNDTSDMFYDCSKLATIYVSDTWDISNVENTSDMFMSDYNLIGEKLTMYDYDYTYGGYARVDEGPSNPGYFTLKGHTKDFAVILDGDDFNEKIKTFNTDGKDFRKATAAEYNLVKDSLTNADIVSTDSPNVYMWETDDSILYYSNASKIYLNRHSYNMFDSVELKTIDLSGFDTTMLYDTSYMFNDCSNLTTIYVSEEWNMNNISNAYNMFSGTNNLVGGQGTPYNYEYSNSEYAHIDGGENDPGYLTDIADKE